MKLSDFLKTYRSDSPDEWTMDIFIRRASALEEELEMLKTSSATHTDTK